MGQKYDHYASLTLTNRSPNSTAYKSIKRESVVKSRSNKSELTKWDNLNFEKFQKFVLSIALRTHFAGKMDRIISLNKKHLDGILGIYRSKTKIDDTSYPILVTQYPKDDNLRTHIVVPYINKIGGHHIIEFSGAGYLFMIYVSSHGKPSFVNSFRFRSDGSMFVMNVHIQETGIFKKMVALAKTAENTSKFI